MKHNKIKYFFTDNWLLILVGFIFIGSFATLYNDVNITILNKLETASALSLAILAFVGFYQYTVEKNKTKNLIRSFDEKLNEDNPDDVALLIQFGGKGDMKEIMEDFAKKIVKEKLMIFKKFGDENSNVNREDIDKLKKYCQEIKPQLVKARKIHIIFGGVAVGLAVITDILNNATDLSFYHREGNQYKEWYTDSKSEQKQEKTPNDIP